MKKFCFVSLFLWMAAFVVSAQMKVSAGVLDVYPDFKSEWIKSRPVYVYLPKGYDAEQKHAVIYMHDGQMLFDGPTTWNGQEWRVDEVLSSLVEEGKIQNCIVVAIANGEADRFYEYFPQKVFDFVDPDRLATLPQEFDRSAFKADSYLRFIVSELKPFIDRKYAVHTDAAHTFLMGSSMGGLISLYGLCEYPDVFSGAACLSIHSVMITSAMLTEDKANLFAPAFCAYLDNHLPSANSCKIYIDLGDQTLDAMYPPFQNKIDQVLWNKGWRKPFWTTNFYAGTAHSEKDWAERLWVPVRFLIGK